MKLSFIVLCLFIFLFCACSSSPKPSTLSNKEWNVNRLSIDTKVLFAPQNATMIFDIDQNRIYGNAGCNNYTANIDTDHNKIIIKRRTFTRKFCESQEVMEYEFEFLRNLEGEYEIITLKEYKDRLSTYGQITNPDLYDSNVPQGMLILANRFKAYFLTQ
ncbi:META domain-containing protein [uncultured Helicobacter sp.]|uniref:META domain-containing protein n=1 Tax=uncultured Helicobacter sp. TaxID=175537 RepID=UPI001C3B95D4|nr:META domain-containing protein [Candidatus Helicobacter avicola]